MKNLKQWLNWKWMEKDGKRTKIPVKPDGSPASSTNPDTWTSYRRASRSEYPIGFVITDEDPYILIDLDHCVGDGEMDTWAKRIIRKVKPAFVDRSPSGDGLHLFIEGRLSENHRRKFTFEGRTVEVYQGKRFVTMPLDPVRGTIEDIGPSVGGLAWLEEVTKRGDDGSGEFAEVISGKTVDTVVGAMREAGAWPSVGEDEWKSEQDFAFFHKIADFVGVPDIRLICDVYLASEVVREKVAKRIDYHVMNALLVHDWTVHGFEELPGEFTEGKSREVVVAEIVADINAMINDHVPIWDVIVEIAKLNDTFVIEGYCKLVAREYDTPVGDVRREINREMNKRVEPLFPDFGENMMGGRAYLSTIDNMCTLIDKYVGLDYHYDVVLKETVTAWRPEDGSDNNLAGKLRSFILSEAVKLGLPKCIIEDHYDMAIKSRERNPLLEAVEAIEWDGVDRVRELERRMGSKTGTREYRREVLKRWMIQAVAAWDGTKRTPNRFARAKYEYVLTLEGGQGVNKTSFFNDIMPGAMNRYLVTGVFLRPGDRDSVKQVTSFGMAELGEIDATFRKGDISEFKAFTSNMFDVYRAAYGRYDERHARRTVLCASVNGTRFLNDPTGSRRFMVLHMTHSIDLQGFDIMQLWAQIWALYLKGEKWWIERGESVWDVQTQINTHATDMGLIEDAFEIFKARLASCGGDGKHTRVSPTKLWESLIGSKPTKSERASFIIQLENAGYHIDKSGIYLPVEFLL